MAWFLQLSTLPNTTQFWIYYYFLLQYYFSSSEIYYFAFLIIFFLFILNHTRLPSPRFLHSILLNFITSSSTLLHLRFAYLLVRLCLLPISVQHCLFSSFEFQISQYELFFFSCIGTFVHFFFFFPFEVFFWFTECKFILVLKTFFFF